MNELIKVNEEYISGEKVQAVNARDLYEFLEVKTPFHKWISRRIIELKLLENRDFCSMDKNVRREIGGVKSKEYFVTIDTAKHLAMMEKNQKGFQVREYFIEVEKEARQAQITMMDNPIVKLAVEHAKLEQEQRRQLQLILDQQNQIDNIGLRAKSIADNQYYTAKAYSIKLGRKYSRSTLAAIGRDCARISKERNIDTGKARDEQFFQVNTYHESVLDEVFESWK